jgi:hypothetical protein
MISHCCFLLNSPLRILDVPGRSDLIQNDKSVYLNRNQRKGREVAIQLANEMGVHPE